LGLISKANISLGGELVPYVSNLITFALYGIVCIFAMNNYLVLLEKGRKGGLVQRSWCRNVFDMTDYEEMIHLFQYPK
jgi:hypothetical protein